MKTVAVAAVAAIAATGLAAQPQSDADLLAIVCSAYYSPAAARSMPGREADCPCIAGYLAERFDSAESEIFIRLLGATTDQNQVMIGHLKALFGDDRLKAVIESFGDASVIGREIDRTCPMTPVSR